MTSRDRARKCTIYLRMYIVPMYHSAYFLQANVLLSRAFFAAHTLHARRYFLFRASPYTRPVSDLSLFSLALFSCTFPGHTDCTSFYIRVFASTYNTHIVICALPKYIHISKRTCICTTARENKVYVLLLLLFVDPSNMYIKLPH